MIRAVNSIALIIAAVLAVALYRAKTEAHDARERVANLAVMVEEERRQAAVLRAEIAFLERPERLRVLAQRHLGLEPTDPAQEVVLEEVLLALGAVDAAPQSPTDPFNPNLRLASQEAEPRPVAVAANPSAAPSAQIIQASLPAPAAARPAPQPQPEALPESRILTAERAPELAPEAVDPEDGFDEPAPSLRLAEDDQIGRLILTGGLGQ